MLEARAQACAPAASTSSSATSSRMGASRPKRLLEGLEQLPTLPVAYRGIVRQEFDLDAALERRPAILLVDELAHSNLIDGDPPPRHAEALAGHRGAARRRHQRLDDGQRPAPREPERSRRADHGRAAARDDARSHLRRGRRDRADRPAAGRSARAPAGRQGLRARSRSATAVERFFRKPNLIALRELALRRMADRVDAAARASLAGDRTSRAGWRGIACSSRSVRMRRPSSSCAPASGSPTRSMRSGRSSTSRRRTLLRLSEQERNRRIDLLRLAESLGAETVTLDGPTAAQALLEYAQTRNATRIVVGAPKRRGWRALLRRSTTTELVASGARLRRRHDRRRPARRAARAAAAPSPRPSMPAPIRWERYVWALAISAACTAVAFAMFPYFELANIVMVYLLGVVDRGLRFGRVPSVLTAVAERALLRLLLRAAAVHVRRVRRAVPA